MAEFHKAYKRTSIYEGGYANIKGDNGGETYAGIARNFHPYWEGWKIIDRNKPLKYNTKIKGAEIEFLVEEFYRKRFWGMMKGDFIHSQIIAEFLYDYTVHSGSRGIKKLQQALGLSQDGIIGPKTIERVNNTDPKKLLEVLVKERYNFLLALSKRPGQGKFRNGWLNRVNSFLYE